MKGNDLIITSGSVIYASKSCDIDTDADTIEVASPMSGRWREYLAGRCGWSVSTAYLVSDAKWRDDLLRVGQKVTLRFKNRDEDATMSGDAIITKCHITATRGNLAQGSFSFLGTGALETI